MKEEEEETGDWSCFIEDWRVESRNFFLFSGLDRLVCCGLLGLAILGFFLLLHILLTNNIFFSVFGYNRICFFKNRNRTDNRNLHKIETEIKTNNRKTENHLVRFGFRLILPTPTIG